MDFHIAVALPLLHPLTDTSPSRLRFCHNIQPDFEAAPLTFLQNIQRA